MSVRQYIGARYVPRFLGTWNNTTQYEALDVVDNGSGTSYIARKTVPAGTPLNNTGFWFVYGASSGAIIDLQSRMGTAENDINGIDALLGNDALITPASTITAAVNQLSQKSTHKYTHSRVIFLSDSYGSRETGGNVKYLTAVANALGCYQHNEFQAGGIGFTNHSGNGTFLGLLQQNAGNVTIDADKVDEIVVLGGTNDHDEAPADILAAVTAFINYCNTTYPNALVSIGFVGAPRLSSDRLVEAAKTANIYKLCMTRKSRYLWGLESVLHLSTYLESDQVHPNNAGVDALVAATCGAMSSGYWRTDYAITPSWTFNTSQTMYSTGTFIGDIAFRIVGETLSIEPANGWLMLTLATPGTIHGQRIKLFTPNIKAVIGSTEARISIPVSIVALDSGNYVVANCMGRLYIDGDGDLSMVFNQTDLQATATISSIRVGFTSGATYPSLGC